MSRFQRLLKITWVIGKYRLDDFLPASHLPATLRLLLLLAPWHFFGRPRLTEGERLRCALEELGPIFVKFGQILSTRKDLLPEAIADELQKLQDSVPPFCNDTARQLIEQGLKRKIPEVFQEFQSTPLASASIAQVHSARLHCGREVVVKVIRPGIEKTIRQDIGLLYLIARSVEKFWDDGHRLRPVEIVTDYEKTIFDELDLQREAANASQLRRNFANSPLIYMPEVFWDYCNTRVMVMERVYGIPISDTATLLAHGTNMKKLAEHGVEIFFTQVFRDSFFHADMHPGNIFVDITDPQNPRYIAIDFGIVGSLTPEDQNYLARNLLAFFNRDYRQVAELHIASGWVPETTKVNEFEAAIRTVCEPIFERPLKDISFGQFLLRLFETARRFDMQVQPQLVLLQKTLLNIEGLGRQLYPDLDLWNTARPYLENWMKQRIAPPGLWKSIKQHFPQWVEQSPEIPQLLLDAVRQIKHLDAYGLNQQQRNLQLQPPGRRGIGVNPDYLIGMAALLAGLFSHNNDLQAWAQALPIHGWLAIIVGSYFLLRPKKV